MCEYWSNKSDVFDVTNLIWINRNEYFLSVARRLSWERERESTDENTLSEGNERKQEYMEFFFRRCVRINWRTIPKRGASDVILRGRRAIFKTISVHTVPDLPTWVILTSPYSLTRGRSWEMITESKVNSVRDFGWFNVKGRSFLVDAQCCLRWYDCVGLPVVLVRVKLTDWSMGVS